MSIKVEVKNCTIYPDTKVIYTDNCVTDELVAKVRELLKTTAKVRVSFDVTGETLHDILSHQMKDAVPEFKTEIGRYKCLITK